MRSNFFSFKVWLTVWLLLGWSLAVAQASQTDLHDAFFAALRSQQGSYQGELKGEFAAYTQKTLKTSAPVFVNVSTVRVFKQKGCKRLRADITVPDMTWINSKTGATETFSYRFEMNLCPDGSPPMEVALETDKSNLHHK